MQVFTPRPVNQKEAQGEKASRGIANGSERPRRRRGDMYSDSAYRVAGMMMRDDEGGDIMIGYAEDDVD